MILRNIIGNIPNSTSLVENIKDITNKNHEAICHLEYVITSLKSLVRKYYALKHQYSILSSDDPFNKLKTKQILLVKPLLEDEINIVSKKFLEETQKLEEDFSLLN